MRNCSAGLKWITRGNPFLIKFKLVQNSWVGEPAMTRWGFLAYNKHKFFCLADVPFFITVASNSLHSLQIMTFQIIFD